MRPWLVGLVVGTFALSACGGSGALSTGGDSEPPPSTAGSVGSVTIQFGGDVMLGRGVAPVWRTDPAAPLEGLRPTVRAADLAVANLESPLTVQAHVVGPYALEADPRAAASIAAAGFDAMAIANNHAGDAGSSTVTDTVDALASAGLPAIGGATPEGPEIVLQDVDGLRIALLAFDASGRTADGVAAWRPAPAHAAVAHAREVADIVAVSAHGGISYRSLPDPFLTKVGMRLARWGADVVWCHGPHVVQPVRAIDPDADGRTTVVATSLGNLLFDDQRIAGTDRGLLLEVRAAADGVVAYRVGRTAAVHGRATFTGWSQPTSDAVAFDGGWWSPAGRLEVAGPPRLGVAALTRLDPTWDVLDAARGDIDGDGRPEVVVLYRSPYERFPLYSVLDHPRALLSDSRGRVQHLAVFGADLRPRWIASTLFRPLAAVAPCDGALAVTYRTLANRKVVATGLWPWNGFGFDAPTNLTGPGVAGCADVDGDGATEPVITGRDPR